MFCFCGGNGIPTIWQSDDNQIVEGLSETSGAASGEGRGGGGDAGSEPVPLCPCPSQEMALPHAPVESPAELRSKRHSKVTTNPLLRVQALVRPSHFTFKKRLGPGVVARFPRIRHLGTLNILNRRALRKQQRQKVALTFPPPPLKQVLLPAKPRRKKHPGVQGQRVPGKK